MTAKDELDKVSAEIKKLYDDRAAFEDKSIKTHKAKLVEFDQKIRNAHHRKAEIHTRFQAEARNPPPTIQKPNPVKVIEVPKVAVRKQ